MLCVRFFRRKNGLNGRAAAGILCAVLFAAAGAAAAGPGRASEGKLTLRAVGHRHFSTRQIAGLLGLRALTGPDSAAEQRLLRKGVERLLAAYRKDGYFSARIDSLLFRRRGRRRELLLYLAEGPPYTLRRLLVLGNRALSLADLRALLPLRPGKRFEGRRLERGIAAVLRRYRQKGYLLARVEIQSLSLDTSRAAVDVILRIREGPPVRLASVRLRGLRQTRPKIVLRELRLHSGEVITEKVLKAVPARLRRLSPVELVRKPQVLFRKDSTAVLLLSFRERGSSRFNGALGYNPPAGARKGYLSGLLDVRLGNLFGSGRVFAAYWQKRGPVTQEMRLDYREPWIAGFPVNGEFRFAQLVQDTLFVRRSWTVGGQVYLFEDGQITFSLGRERVLVDSLARNRFRLPGSRAGVLNAAFALENLDNPANPSRGFRYRTGVELLRKRLDFSPDSLLPRSQEVRRVRLDFELAVPLFRRQVIYVALHGREVRTGGRSVPLDELFRVGGSSGLRGYRDDQFWGDRVLLGTLEYRFLLDRDARFALFLDAGSIGRRKGKLVQTLFRVGYGFGLQTRTDLGLIGFDYGLGQGDSFLQGKLHLRLINTF